MKTQINTLISGSNGIVGTSMTERMRIASLVKSENENGMKIDFEGIEINMTANWSLSRKSCQFSGILPTEIYTKLFGNHGIAKDGIAYISIEDSMTVKITTNSKFRNSGKKGFQRIEESRIFIK
jgi:hypothetical protein